MKTDVHPQGPGTPGRRSLIRVLIFVVIVFGFFTMASATFTPLLAVSPEPKSVQAVASPGRGTPTLSPTLSRVVQTRSARISSAGLRDQTQVDASTVALYHFDSDFSDATGLHTAAPVGNAAIGSGLYGNALVLDGAGSYVATGNVGALSQGTLEAFIDFSAACYTASEDFTLISVIDAGGQPVAALRVQPWLDFGIFANGQWQWVTSTINACRYLQGGITPVDPVWPYETWRFHHVAATWGPRGLELWVDGVLHGVGVHDLYYDPTVQTNLRPTYGCNPQDQLASSTYPKCDLPQMGLVPQAYGGGLPPYSSFLIGCGFNGTCFKGRIDEVRISNIQRTFSVSVDPASTPTPTQTPIALSGNYAVDPYTVDLFHFDSGVGSRTAFEEVGQSSVPISGRGLIVPGGRFGSAMQLDGNESYLSVSNMGDPASGTVETWVNLAAVTGSFEVIGARSYYNSASDMLYVGESAKDGNTVRFGILAGGDFIWADSGVDASRLVGSWHHIAGTWGPLGMQLWLDGTLCRTTSYTGAPGPAFTYTVGCGATGNCIQGKMDEVRFSSVQRRFSPSGLDFRDSPRLDAPGRDRSAVDFWSFLPFVPVGPPTTAINCPVQ